jgi:O-antigen/teichoic acid export membrane protein
VESEAVSPEKKVRRVAKNAIAQGARFAATVISKFLIVVVIARLGDVEQVGDFSFVITFSMAFGVLNNFGLVILLVREIARERERVREYVGNTLTLCLGLGVLSIVATGGVAFGLGFSNDLVIAIYLAAIAMVIDTLGNLFDGAFSGHERMELGAAAIILQELGFLIIGVAILSLHLPFLWIFVVFILSRLIGFVASLLIYRHYWGWPRLRFDLPIMKGLMRKTLPFAANIAFGPIFVRVDVLMLSYFKGNRSVGYYEVASTLFYRLNVLARMFNIAMLPLIAHEYPKIGQGVVQYVRSAVKFQAVLAMPITMFCWVLGAKLIQFIFGAEFAPSTLAFQIMASITFLRFLDNTLGLTLTAINLESRRAVATAGMAFFNIGINWFVLPRFDYFGAAVTSVITEIGYFLLLYAFIRSRLPNPIEPTALIRPILASLVMALPILFLRGLPLLILLPLGIVIYLLAVFAFRVFSAMELDFLLRAGGVKHLVPASLMRFLAPTPKMPDQAPGSSG